MPARAAGDGDADDLGLLAGEPAQGGRGLPAGVNVRRRRWLVREAPVGAGARPSASAWPAPEAWGGSAIQWLAVGQAATRRAEPATAAAAARAGLFCKTDTIGDNCGAGGPHRARWTNAGGPRWGGRTTVAGPRWGGWTNAGEPRWGGRTNAGQAYGAGRSCGTRSSLLLGAPGALSCHPAAGLGKPIASGVRILRGFTAARSWGCHTRGAVGEQIWTTRTSRRARTTQKTAMTTSCRYAARLIPNGRQHPAGTGPGRGATAQIGRSGMPSRCLLGLLEVCRGVVS